MSPWRRAILGVFLLAMALPAPAPAISMVDHYSAFEPSSLSLHPAAATVLDAAGLPLPLTSDLRPLTSVGFTGRYHDAETGLIFYRARYYDPALGRFISRDPIAEWGGINLYGYCGGNPVGAIDPWGYWGIQIGSVKIGVGDMTLAFGDIGQNVGDVGFSKGWKEGAVVMADYATFGATQLNERATQIQKDAIASGDILSQVGYGAGKVGIEALYSIPVMKGFQVVGKGAQAIGRTRQALNVIARHPQWVRGVGAFGRGAGTVLRGVGYGMTARQLKASYDAFRDCDYITATQSLGEATLLSMLASYAKGPRVGRAPNSGSRWNNGWRTADGKFASPNGAGRGGAAAEQGVWDAVKQKPGWSVTEGQVGVRNASGQLRYYDGAAVSPRGRVIGLEVKSGSAVKTGAQRTFDAGVNTYNPATGVGKNAGLEVGRALEIKVP